MSVNLIVGEIGVNRKYANKWQTLYYIKLYQVDLGCNHLGCIQLYLL